MKVVILAGGYGTRLQEETVVKPKPMVEIGEYPILMHIMRCYASFGFKEFVVALGYKGEMILEYFLHSSYLRRGVTVNLGSGAITTHSGYAEDLIVHLIDTGMRTQTGGRLKRLQPHLGDQPFMMTYGDGLADIDIRGLLAFHRSHGRCATVTAAHPPGRFGALSLDGDRVREFSEKSQVHEGWINAGFFVLEPKIFNYITGDETLFEREPLERLAAEGELMAYRHEGFWQPMDTLREKRILESLWESGRAPWNV